MDALNLIYYSPTGTTQKIVREIGENLGVKRISEYNISENEIESIPVLNNSLTIFGLPVYGGRLPLTAIETLKKFQSNQSPAVIVVVYGNRDYDDSLLELQEIANNCGFKVIAGAAFIGEHSYSSNEKPIAQNRPDKQDLEKCKDFSKLVIKKIKHISKLTAPTIPGNYPYKERKQLPANVHPETDNKRCNKCGICVDVCPTNAISIEDLVITDGELCTLCCACVKYCPEEARTFDHPKINEIRERLLLNCSTRKEPLFFV
ncbi:EFR1 family ferrodoxin [Lutibacter citreus]|uniref:EFR1 family ferrodoxin n=1 Tax=Lutibacter citreus TaxID=2138210 RepID=UPI000DBE70FE|nr:EFR1 family ferrodoxin [Lutibacter citreus]